MGKKIKTYRDLNIWKAGIELVKDVYRLTEKFPILYVTLGSCAELETQITIAKELTYIQESKEVRLLGKLDHTGRMITTLLKKL